MTNCLDALRASAKARKGNIKEPPFSEEKGGKLFVEAVRKYGRNDKKQPLTILPWHEEYMEALGDMRIARTVTTGAAQTGKTLFHYMLFLYMVAVAGKNVLWAYAQRETMYQCVSVQFKPIANQFAEAMKIKPVSDSIRRWVVNSGIGMFTHVNSARKANADTGAAASNSVVSVSADLLIREERSQYSATAAATLLQRLNASALTYKPERDLGTPGNGSGIEQEIKKCHKYFYPAVWCRNCGELAFLDPKGALLRPFPGKDSKGREVVRYWNLAQKPEKFFSKDGTADGAYIGCPHCEAEIPDCDRAEARFYDRQSGQPLREFLDTLDLSSGKRWAIGLNLSPLLRQAKYNVAADLINIGVESSNPPDWIQQSLGIPTEPEAIQIDKEILCKCIGTKPPESGKSVVLAGLDQGAMDYLSIARYHFPEGWETKDIIELLDTSYREMLFSDRVARSEVPELLKRFGVEFGLVDNEPDKDWASGFALYNPVQPADQIDSLKIPFDVGERSTGGKGFEVYRIRSPRFKARLVRLVNDEYFSFPLDWELYKSVTTGYSPIAHMCAVWFDDKENQWMRPGNHNDDIFFATMFMEASFEIWLERYKNNSIDWWDSFLSQPN